MKVSSPPNVPPPAIAAVLLASLLVACSPSAATSAAGASTSRPPAAITTPSATTDPLAGLAPFVGDWNAHGASLSIRADGLVAMIWRTYRDCADDPRPPCDEMVGDEIRSGGKAAIRITSASGRTALGTVTESTDPKLLPVGADVSIDLLPGDTIELGPAGMRFCGPRAAPGSCGA